MIVVPVVAVKAFEDEDRPLSVVREHLDLEQIRAWVAAVFAFYALFGVRFVDVRVIDIRFIGLRETVRKAVRIVEDGLSALLLVYPVPELFAALLTDVETDKDTLVVQPVRLI